MLAAYQRTLVDGMDLHFIDDEDQIVKVVSQVEVMNTLCGRPVGSRRPRLTEVKLVSLVL